MNKISTNMKKFIKICWIEIISWKVVFPFNDWNLFVRDFYAEWFSGGPWYVLHVYVWWCLGNNCTVVLLKRPPILADECGVIKQVVSIRFGIFLSGVLSQVVARRGGLRKAHCVFFSSTKCPNQPLLLYGVGFVYILNTYGYVESNEREEKVLQVSTKGDYRCQGACNPYAFIIYRCRYDLLSSPHLTGIYNPASYCFH